MDFPIQNIPMQSIPIICGPTSTGKTSLALNLAKKLNAVIISADSRQIYKQMDIGTGKLPVSANHIVKKSKETWEIDGVTVYGYDLVHPNEVYSAFDFCNYARGVIEENFVHNKRVLVVGGTGFYIDTLTGKVLPSGAPPDHFLRAELNTLSLDMLQEKLHVLSIDIFNSIDIKNKVRLIRAIEKLTHPVSAASLKQLPFDAKYVYLGLKASNEYMYSKADLWAELVWKNGLVNETQKLISLGYQNAAPLNGIIYKSVQAYINGSMTSEAVLQRIKYDLHSYIRRQLTWFKKNTDIHWCDVSVLSEEQIKSDALRLFSV
ncbi:tRNA (adenosine(37)-N6)-dimethylallyltransferase MiaA [candidate division WWE3 bacterium]|uniref:tRNA dimethylallyltransferase n=1 Tax=candidate division WWE3 bacterium TaxID=2053526 RepID=A0A7X9HGT6_UNCKA|nr:tRNA (adenosine(37)-N6)-dimethylallyltransferase MiaA [candidate division WWE3 bacterium]